MIQMADNLVMDGVRKTRDGYLTASVKASRTGIQNYRGSEVGKPDMQMVRVYRPETEVFHKDALASFTSIPLTNDHPPENVTADNWRKYAIGNTGEEVARDGDSMRIPIILKDAMAIGAVEGGKNQLSCGYTCDLDWTAGKSPTGDEYDAIQTNIRGNHLAIVARGRAGPEFRIGDNANMKTIMIDGHSVEVSDAAEIAIANVTRKLIDAEAKLVTVTTDLTAKDTKIAELATQVSTKDAEIVTLKKAVTDATITPEKLRDAAKSYARSIAIAKAIAPTATVTDSMDEPSIRKAVVNAKLGDAAKDWTDAQIETSFATLAANVKVADANHALADGLATTVNTNDAVAEREKARQSRFSHFETAHNSTKAA